MKINNLKSSTSLQEKFETENIDIQGQGITKKLLERYKPKSLCNIENIDNRKNEKRVA